MKKGLLSALVLLALALTAILPVAGPARGALGDVSVEMYMPGEAKMTNDTTNLSVMVAGVIHALHVNLTAGAYASVSNVTVACHLGSAVPATQNDTNYYSWSWIGGAWSDAIYGLYLNSSQCAASGNNYKFAVGMSARAVEGTWRMVVYVDGAADLTMDFAVESPDAGFSLSRPDFLFSVTPFQTSVVSSFNQNNQSFHIRSNNGGNVPLKLQFRFEPLGQYFTITNDSTVFHVDEMRYHYIGFNAPAWSPREFNVSGTVRGEPQYLITPATVALVPAFELDFSITVMVHRTGYTLLDFGKVIVQYVKNVPSLDYGNSTTLDAFFTGEGTATLALDAYGVTITSATLDGTTVDPAASIPMTLSNTTERHLRLIVNATKASPTAFTAKVNYTVTWTDGGASRAEKFNTSIVVNGADVVESEEPAPLNWLAIGAIAAIVVVLLGFMAYYSNVKKRERLARKQRKKGRGKSG